jgi:hypothetical protein
MLFDKCTIINSRKIKVKNQQRKCKVIDEQQSDETHIKGYPKTSKLTTNVSRISSPRSTRKVTKILNTKLSAKNRNTALPPLVPIPPFLK